MKEYKFSGIDELIYYDKLANGMEVYFYPNKKAKNFYMTLNVRFGSVYTDFKVDGNTNYYHVPNGIAHFLEHLMFYEPNGVSAHEKFASLGSSCNAATSFKSTYYEVTGTSKFKENLEYLLDYVQRPYFTKENVSKERNIIIEEINGGKSSPYRELFFGSRQNLLKTSKFRIPVSGEVSDVKKITRKDIKLCYDTFYHPSNMFIIITGNFNPYEALAIINENQNSKEFAKYQNPKLKDVIEPLKVFKAFEERKMNVEVSKVSYSIKLDRNLFKGIDDYRLNRYLYSYYGSKLGRTSILKETLLNNNLVVNGPISAVNVYDNIVMININFDSLYPKEALKLIKEVLKNKNITAKDLKSRSRVRISNLILGFDDIFNVHDNLQQQVYLYNKISYDAYDFYNKMTVKESNAITNKITYDNASTYIIIPEKKEL